MLSSSSRAQPPYRLIGLLALIVVVAVVVSLFRVYRGDFASSTASITVFTTRAGLLVDTGSKVTLNGVAIGRVRSVQAEDAGRSISARLHLAVDSRFVGLIPDDANVRIAATTVFGVKQVAFTTGRSSTSKHVRDGGQIDARSVTVEFNTLFETVVSLAEKVDPVKLNQTLSATAQALDGLGERFGQSIENGNGVLEDVNPQMRRIQEDNQRLAELADVYANASPNLFDGLDNAVVTARRLNEQQRNVDEALMAAVGFGNTGGKVFEEGSPYLVRGAADSVPTNALLDEYSPMLFCTIRNYHDVEPGNASALGGNGYSAATLTELIGAGNPYVYPDNLPRVNARGGPEGKPGCWQPVTRDLWPAPYLVMDTGASIAPYNHFELGQPILTEYIWGRQVGENTINP